MTTEKRSRDKGTARSARKLAERYKQKHPDADRAAIEVSRTSANRKGLTKAMRRVGARPGDRVRVELELLARRFCQDEQGALASLVAGAHCVAQVSEP